MSTPPNTNPAVLSPTTLDPAQESPPAAPTIPSPPARRREKPLGVDSDGRLRSGKLAGLSMSAAMITLAWPILIESVLNSLVGLTDTYLAAQLSEAATDAVGGASYVMWFIGLCVMAVASGATALVSRSVGKSRLAVANAALAQSMILAVGIGLVVGAFVALSAPLAASIMSLRGGAREDFVHYMRIIALGVPGIAILTSGIAGARGVGDSLRPLWAIVIVNVVNMAISFALSGVDLTRVDPNNPAAPARVILENPFDFNLGVSGIGLGTVIGDYIGALFILALLYRGTSGLTLIRRRFRPHWITLKRLIRLAVPSFAEMFGMWIGNFLIILMVGWIGLERLHALTHSGSGVESDLLDTASSGGAMGAHIIAIRIESFSYLPGFAIGTAAATLVGQYLGARAPHLARRAVNISAAITAGLMGLAGLAFILFPRSIVGLISSQPTHLELAPPLLFITGWAQIPFGLSIVYRSALRGAGDAKAVAYLMWISTYAVRLPLVYLIAGVDIPVPAFIAGREGVFIEHPIFEDASLTRLWIALCTEIFVRAALYFWRFKKDAWTRAVV